MATQLPVRRLRRLHGCPADRQPARRLHRRTRHSRGDVAAARQGDRLLRDGVRATRPARAGMSGSGSSRRRASFRSRAIRCSARRSCSPGRCSLPRSASRPDAGSFPCRSSARTTASSSDGCHSRFRRSSEYAEVDSLLEALGVEGSRACPWRRYDNGVPHVYVALGSEPEVAALEPGPAEARAPRPRHRSRSSASTASPAPAASGRRGCSRPPTGCPEDPATGSAAGPLAYHLARHGAIAFGEEIEISQGAELGRPSTLYARVDGSPERVEAIEVGGSAVIVARGEFRL